ncbi:dockerin type I repeat-containing protein [Ruminococcus albus]|uniref:Dockerin domain-containing protein n=1 Tax=Ruminococcus albus TaxID=1264 RepID=A0A1H7H0J4_RUMAL|nr:dockerin type I repeat-containing protein [Ruminococcus albus]SEK42792.1 hypothetical protein SAMN05216469_102307 [Ruminococcus albus]
MKTMKKRIISLAMAAVSAVTMISSGITASADYWDKKPILFKKDGLNITWNEKSSHYEIKHLRGDLNRNGTLDDEDFRRLTAYVKGAPAEYYHGNMPILVLGNGGATFYEKDFISHFGDINFDGKVNVTDIVILAAHLKGKRTLDKTLTWGVH